MHNIPGVCRVMECRLLSHTAGQYISTFEAWSVLIVCSLQNKKAAHVLWQGFMQNSEQKSSISAKWANQKTCCIGNVHCNSAAMVTDLWPKLKLMKWTKRWQNTSERPTFAKVHLSNNGVIKSTRQYWISITKGFIVYVTGEVVHVKNKKKILYNFISFMKSSHC